MHAETLGETQRVKSISGYLKEKHEILVVNAGVGMDLGDVESVQLPNPFYNKENHKTQTFQRIPPALIKERAIALLRAVKEFAPDIIITKSFPFQYPELKYELLPMLKYAKQSSVKLICSVGYPLGTVNPMLVKDILEQFDHILVHCPRDLDPEYIARYYGEEATNSFLLNSPKVTFTGYVLPEESIVAYNSSSENSNSCVKPGSKLAHDVHHKEWSKGMVLVSRGSGVVNDDMLIPAVEAVLESSMNCVVVNGLVGEDSLREEIETKFKSEIDSGKLQVYQHMDQETYTRSFIKSRYSISTCGYGTAVQLLYTRKSGILIPKMIDQEQWYRAKMLEDMLGSITLKNPKKEDIKAALASLEQAQVDVKDEWFDGLKRTEEVIENVANNRITN